MPEPLPPAGRVPAADWLYYRVYPGHIPPSPMHPDPATDLDALLVEILSPVLAQLRTEVPELRWFFLRFTDPTGVHIRLRLHARLAALAHIEGVLEGALRAAGPPGPSFSTHLYSPETQKFGSGSGMRLAEELFQASSTTVLALLASKPTGPRVGWAAGHLLELLETLPARQRLGFLHHYAWYWAGGPAGRQRGLAAANVAAQDRAAAVLAQARRVLATPGPGQILRRYGQRYRAAMGDAAWRRIPRTDYLLLFHHVHLTHNRLGVFPATEAALARALWLALSAPGQDPAEVVTNVIPPPPTTPGQSVRSVLAAAQTPS